MLVIILWILTVILLSVLAALIIIAHWKFNILYKLEDAAAAAEYVQTYPNSPEARRRFFTAMGLAIVVGGLTAILLFWHTPGVRHIFLFPLGAIIGYLLCSGMWPKEVKPHLQRNEVE